MKKVSLALMVLLSLSGCMNENERAATTLVPYYEIARATGKIKVDGKLDELSWSRAKVIKLQFPWPEQTGEKQSTNAKLLWDDEYLYVAYSCIDKDINARYEKHDDPTYEDDAVELFINPNPALNTYIGLEMNARGVLYDYLYKFPRSLEKSYDLKGVLLNVQRDGTLNDSSDVDKGWILELAIPLSNFYEFSDSKKVVVGTQWSANINRWDGLNPNRRLSMWSDSGQIFPNPHNPRKFSQIRFSN